MLGIVKWFKEQRGYGFVVDENGENYFVHYTGILSETGFRKLIPLQMVEFSLANNERGPIAVDVKAVETSDEVKQKYIDILIENGVDISIVNKTLERIKKNDKFYKGGKKNEQQIEDAH